MGMVLMAAVYVIVAILLYGLVYWYSKDDDPAYVLLAVIWPVSLPAMILITPILIMAVVLFAVQALVDWLKARREGGAG
jgi:hypothetical protein